MVGDIVRANRRIGFARDDDDRFLILAELGEFVAVAPLEPASPFEGFSLAVKVSRGRRVALLAKLACIPASKLGEKVGTISVDDLGRTREALALMFDL